MESIIKRNVTPVTVSKVPLQRFRFERTANFLLLFLSSLINGLIICIFVFIPAELLSEYFHPKSSQAIQEYYWAVYTLSFSGCLIMLAHLVCSLGLVERWYSLFCKARTPSERELAKISPLLETVRAKTPLRRINLYISDETGFEAYAFGRKSLVLSKELINSFSDDEIKAVIGHELSHLIHKDTAYLTRSMAVRTVSSYVALISHWFSLFCYWTLEVIAVIPFAIVIAVPVLIVLGGLWIILLGATLPFIYLDRNLLSFLELKLFRKKEYRADAFASSLTSPAAMISALEKLKEETKAIPKSFWMRLLDTHPHVEYRLDRMDRLRNTKKPEKDLRAYYLNYGRV